MWRFNEKKNTNLFKRWKKQSEIQFLGVSVIPSSLWTHDQDHPPGGAVTLSTNLSAWNEATLLCYTIFYLLYCMYLLYFIIVLHLLLLPSVFPFPYCYLLDFWLVRLEPSQTWSSLFYSISRFIRINIITSLTWRSRLAGLLLVTTKHTSLITWSR